MPVGADCDITRFGRLTLCCFVALLVSLCSAGTLKKDTQVMEAVRGLFNHMNHSKAGLLMSPPVEFNVSKK